MGDAPEKNDISSDQTSEVIDSKDVSSSDHPIDKSSLEENLENDNSEFESEKNATDVDQIRSDQDVKLKKLKSKSLDSESEQRNTSTSNAGESEYESANEEDIADFDNTPETRVPIESASIVSADLKNLDDPTIPSANENFDNVQKGNESNEISSPSENMANEVNVNIDEEPVEEQVLSKIRPRRRGKLSDDEFFEEQVKFDASDEENTNDLDDESFDEAEGQFMDNKPSDDDDALKSIPDDERENGDGQESENQDNKSSKAAASGKVGKKGEIEDKRNPQYIPRKGPFYEHDDRILEEVSQEAPKSATDSEEGGDAEKLKNKKRLMASMKLRSDDMNDEELEDDSSRKSVSKEKLHDISSQSVESLEKAVSVKGDLKSPREVKKKPIWDSRDRWSHDKFNVDDQKPKSRDELINLYGYDIRNENDAPKLQRRSKYGKGPQKYSRRSEDENAYAKKTLRKVIVKPRGRAEDANEFDSQPPKKDQVFNNKPLPNSERKISKENITFQERRSTTANYSNSYPDSANRVHENRVFVNKSGPRYNKSEKPRSRDQESYNNIHAESFESRRENVSNFVEPIVNEKPTSKELFTNEDFPELISTNKAQSGEQQSKENNKNVILYYQQPSDNKSINDTHYSNNWAESQEPNFESEPIKPKSPVTVVKSLVYENSRYSRTRNNYPNNQEYSANWNNNNRGPPSAGRSLQFSSNQPTKKPLGHTNVGKDESLNEVNEQNQSTNSDSRPKRYSSIRQQQQRTINTTSNASSQAGGQTRGQSTFESKNAHLRPAPQIANNNESSNKVNPSSPAQTVNQFTAVVSQASAPATTQQQYINLNADGTPANILPTEPNKNTYYESTSVAASEISHGQSPNLIPNPTSHHHATPHAHPNYAPINGPATGASATGTAAYIPTATPMMAYYDPNAASGQPSGTATTGLQAPIGLTQAYFTTDQAGTPQPNYYLTAADLTQVAYHPAYHLPTNYPQPIPSHHSHQSHVTNRYLNTAPVNAPSAESSRYLQTVPSTQSSTPILVAGQPYQAAIQPAFPSGYPQFPPPAPSGAAPTLGTSSPLPAGYPNVPMGSSNASSTSTVANAQPQTPSGYPELYRGGITYYDIQSQQQAMQRHLNLTPQQPQTQQQQHTAQPRRSKGHHHSPAHDGVDNAELNVDMNSEVANKGTKHSAKNEISVGN